MLDGACHCGALAVRLHATRPPAELPVRVCGCTFCRKHRPRYTTDPAGHVELVLARPVDVSRYRFGLRLADFLLCRACGVFVAAHEPGEPGAPGRAVINLACLTDADAFVAAPTAFTAYDDEDVPTRAARRARTWTPATLADR